MSLTLQLHNQGKPQTEIAKIMGVTQSAVSRVLSKFPDTRKIARAMITASAVQMVHHTMKAAKIAADGGDATPALEVLDRLDVLSAKRSATPSTAGSRVVVIVGGVPGLSTPAVNALPDFTDGETTGELAGEITGGQL